MIKMACKRNFGRLLWLQVQKMGVVSFRKFSNFVRVVIDDDSHTEIVYKFCIQKLCKMYTTDVCKMYTRCIQNVSHISTNFSIHFVYKIKRTMAVKIRIQNVYKSLSKCGIHFVYINSDLQKVYILKNYVYNLYTKYMQNVYK